MAEIMDLERPLEVETIVNYMAKWFSETLKKKQFVTRATYNVLQQRKINAVMRVLKMIGSNVDVLLETTLRQKIMEKLMTL